MSISWKQCEGQVINNTFPLQQYLGGSRNSAVFLTQLSGTEPVKAAIKFIPEGHASDLQLSLWRRAAQLSHPNLLKIFESGRCRLANEDLLYVTMEFAEEDLSQILPERALAPAEARDMLQPLLSALIYLHYHGLIHSHIKPSNVLATGDQLKLSSDTLFPVGESRRSTGRPDAYTAPEAGRVPCSPAADVWALGMTLVETLTQNAVEWNPASEADPIVPQAIPQPFQDIARHMLRRDPRLRWSIEEIGACLNPVAVAAAAAQSASPLAIPLSSVPAVPAAKLQSPRPFIPASRPQAAGEQAANAPKQMVLLPSYVLPVAAVLVLLVGIFALPKILRRSTDTSAPAAAAAPAASPSEGQVAAATKTEPPSVTKASRPARQAEQKSPSSESSSLAVAKVPAASDKQPPAEPAALRTQTTSTADVPKSSAAGSSRGEVLDQVLPEASQKAQATIQGTVRVTVLLHVDAAGNVSDATLDSPGPSQYFANLALTAARRWEFTSPEANGRSMPSEWRVRFEFRSTGVKAYPTQTAP